MTSERPESLLPWFRARPGLTVVVTVTLFVAVFVLRVTTGATTDVSNMLYTFPIALAAMAFGFRTGIGAGLLATALVVASVMVDYVHLTPFGWFSQVAPLILLGGLLGDASDRLRRATARLRSLEAAAQRHRDAVEINDTLVQGMAAAKWSLEAGRHETALKTLADTLELGHGLVSRLMREADMGLNGHRSSVREETDANHLPS